MIPRRLVAAVLVIAAIPVAPAWGHFEALVREVHPGPFLSQDSAFVELQSYSPNQLRLAGNVLETYGPTGLKLDSFVIPAHAANGQSQRTLLIGDSNLSGTADFVNPNLGGALMSGGGAFCFPEALPADCVSWGSFSGGGLPFPGPGPPAPAIGDGQSLTRTLARGCATALDRADDTNKSNSDFALTAPSPRPNSVIPSELECVSCGGREATLVGTNGPEVLKGTAGKDVIAALAGKDTVRGRGGDDVLCGGIGKDTLLGGKGRDRLIGERGRDLCRGGAGKDKAKSCELRNSI